MTKNGLILSDDGTTVIGRDDTKSLKTLVIPDGIENIRCDNFGDCIELILPSTVKKISERSFFHVSKISVYGDIPSGLLYAITPSFNADYYYYINSYDYELEEQKVCFETTELVINGLVTFIPKYINTMTDMPDGSLVKDKIIYVENLIKNGSNDDLQTLYKFGGITSVKLDTAYCMYRYLIQHQVKPCDELKRYVKRVSLNITKRLMELEKTEDVSWFLAQNLLTKSALQKTYDFIMENDNLKAKTHFLAIMKTIEKK